MDSFDPPRIARPKADLAAPSFTDITLIGEWVASLPVANTDQTALALAKATEEIARLILPFSERLDALEAIRPAVEYICSRLDQAALQRSAQNSRGPKVAQKLARHSDIRLTLGVYTHAELADQTAAIEALPGPPGAIGLNDRKLRVVG